jgi:hypothetical protein
MLKFLLGILVGLCAVAGAAFAQVQTMPRPFSIAAIGDRVG